MSKPELTTRQQGIDPIETTMDKSAWNKNLLFGPLGHSGSSKDKDSLKEILDHMSDGAYILNGEYELEYVNPSLKLERGEIDGRKCFNYLAGLNEPCPWCKSSHVFAGDSLNWERASSMTGKNYEIFETPIRNTDGSVSKLAILRDITKRKELENSLREQNEFLRTLLNSIPAPIFFKGIDGRYIGFNESFRQLLGYRSEDLIGKTAFDVYPKEIAEIFSERDRDLFNDRGVQVDQCQISDSSGLLHDVISHKSVFSNSLGNLIGMIGVLLDVTKLKRTERALKEREQFLRHSEKIARVGGWKANPSTNMLYWTEGVYDIMETSRDYKPGFDEGLLFYKPAYRRILKDAIEQSMKTGEGFSIEAEFITSTGKHLWAEIRGLALEVSDGELEVIGSLQDITERKMAEQAQKRLFMAVEQVSEGVVITDPHGTIQYVNPAEETISGYTCDELIGRRVDIFQSDRHDKAFHASMWKNIESGQTWEGRFINRRKDGTEYYEDNTISPVYDPLGTLTNFIALKRDVTGHLELQERLFQSQKLEATGAVAGGFAHDLINKFQIIRSLFEEVFSGKNHSKGHESDLATIKRAIDGCSELMRSMLVFNKKADGQLMQLDLNKIVVNMNKMVAPVMPRNIETDLILADGIWAVKGNMTEIEQVLMNLMLNARDSMPDGGILSIETRNVQITEELCRLHPNTKPGRYVLLSVTDTGKGMDNHTLKHIFDPFFTTKDRDSGTGLGLWIVYGLVGKHRGMITCSSQPAIGTSFDIYLPSVVVNDNLCGRRS